MERCYDIRDLPDLASLPADDPRRIHLAVCPKCRGQADALAVFLGPGETSDLEDLASADARLQQRLAAAWVTPAPVVSAQRRRLRWYGLAAVLAVCALGLTTGELLRLRPGIPLRVGDHLRGAEEATGLTVGAQDAVWQATWADAPIADSYVLLWLGNELSTIASVEATKPEFSAPIADLSPDVRFCQAFAVSHGDTLGRSAIVRIQPVRE
jgi:hypothetical protein